MTDEVALATGRELFKRRVWGDAYAHLSAASRDVPLGAEDLDRLAVAAYLTGRDTESTEIWGRAHHEWLRLGETEGAVRCAFWLAFGLLQKGEIARGGGWLARARRLIEGHQHDCVEQGYLLVPAALQYLEGGDAANAYATFSQVVQIGERFGDPDLVALGRLGRGKSQIHLGDVVAGIALLDETMVAVTSGEVSPIASGIIYCAVIEACQELFDLRRAQEWTAALNDWCASQPDLVPYRGQCLVHRAEIMQMHGEWLDALDEARRAGEWLSRSPGQPAVGMAIYQQAELHRLRGELARAESLYREASQWGRLPQPGLALMRLSQGHVDAAASTIRRALDEAQGRVARSRLLPAYVEIMLEARDVPAARAAADELADVSSQIGAPLLQAVSAYAMGAVLLAEDNARAGLASLRQAWIFWQEIDAPYEAARTRVLMGLACRKLGDEDGAELEMEAARAVFRQLGAAPDLRRLDGLARKQATTISAEAASGLTSRELEVIRLLAAGRTNRGIAGELVISEKTVARHVNNIFAKLNVSSRAAATAYVYERGLALGASPGRT